MESTTTLGATGLRVAALALMAACGSSEGPVLSGDSPSGGDAGSSFFSGDASATAAFDADIEENHVAVTFITLNCSGDCATVEAVGRGGHPPYTFKWDDSSTNATRQVCPASTTSYDVAVTDTGTVGELTRPAQTAEADVTADVIECPDGGAPSGGPPPELAHDLCSVRWPWAMSALAPTAIIYGTVTLGVYGESTVAVDPSNDILVEATYYGAVTVGSTQYTARGPSDTLIVKLDPQCNVLWARDFGNAGASVQSWTITSDSASDVIFGGLFTGSVDFGFGAVTSSLTTPGAFVVKLDRNGTPVWVRTPDVNLSDVASDGQGSVALTMSPWTLGDAGTTVSQIEQLDPSGATLYSEDESAPIFSVDGPVLAVGGNAAGELIVAGLGAGSTSGVGPLGAAAAIGPGGAMAWDLALRAPAGPSQPALSAVRGALDATGNAFVMQAWQPTNNSDGSLPNWATLTRVSPAGAVVWTTSTLSFAQPPLALQIYDDGTAEHAIALDAAGNSFLITTLQGSANFPALGTMTATGTSDAAFLVVDSSGALRAAGHWGAAGLDQSAQSIAVDSSDAVVLTGSGARGEFYVAKLGG